MKRTKTQKGITLIALIITIVVLLILAAVAISSITNEGILQYATNAAKGYNNAVANEQSMLQEYQNYLKNYIGGTDSEDDTPVEEESPNTVSGVWTLNETLSISSIYGYTTYNVNFTANGQSYNSMIIQLETVDNMLTYASTTGNSKYAYYTPGAAQVLGADEGWQENNINVIDFGTETQTVDEEFKTWLVANATKGNNGGIQLVRPTISGVWKFKDTISLTEPISQTVTFTTNGSSETGMNICMETVDYILVYSSTPWDNAAYYTEAFANGYVSLNKTAGWQNEAYKTVDFGSQAQEVSETFKTWLEANATQQ